MATDDSNAGPRADRTARWSHNRGTKELLLDSPNGLVPSERGDGFRQRFHADDLHRGRHLLGVGGLFSRADDQLRSRFLGADDLLTHPADGPDLARRIDRPGACDDLAAGELTRLEQVDDAEGEEQPRGRAADTS